jgi:predicted HTH domain antitoxin
MERPGSHRKRMRSVAQDAFYDADDIQKDVSLQLKMSRCIVDLYVNSNVSLTTISE